jgi:hypothetical protein
LTSWRKFPSASLKKLYSVFPHTDTSFPDNEIHEALRNVLHMAIEVFLVPFENRLTGDFEILILNIVCPIPYTDG